MYIYMFVFMCKNVSHSNLTSLSVLLLCSEYVVVYTKTFSVYKGCSYENQFLYCGYTEIITLPEVGTVKGIM